MDEKKPKFTEPPPSTSAGVKELSAWVNAAPTREERRDRDELIFLRSYCLHPDADHPEVLLGRMLECGTPIATRTCETIFLTTVACARLVSARIPWFRVSQREGVWDVTVGQEDASLLYDQDP